MKKFMFVLCLMILSLPIIAQVDSTGVTLSQPFTFDFNAWVATLSTIAATAVFLGAFLIQIFKVTVKIWKQIIVWLVAIALTVLGNLLNIGFAAEFPWLTTIVYGLASGLVANGIFDISTVQGILAFLKLKEKKV
jgi:hypothetical protein